MAKAKYPAELVAACKVWGVEPEALLSWAVRPEEVVGILPNGSKVKLKADAEPTEDNQAEA